MKILCDTHVLLWYLQAQTWHFSPLTQQRLLDGANVLYFSSASIWETAIKHSLGKPDFDCDPNLITQELLGQGFQLLNIGLAHILTVNTLPLLHKDPFDRLLLAQAMRENVHLFTADQAVLRYDYPQLVDVR